jgi:Mn2+/Fe2+ NRAMP family transporter
MLAVPVLAGSAAYAVTESFDWRTGLDMRLHEAREFYGIIAFATVGGVLLNFTRIDPIRALLWSADINCVIAVPIMAVMMRLGANPAIMGTLAIRSRLRNLGWAATVLMGITVVAMFATM